MTNATLADGTQIDLSLFGIEPDSFLAPELSSGEGLGDIAGIVVSETAQHERVELGSIVIFDRLETEFEVVGFTTGQATFGHVDMAYLTLDAWKLVASGAAEPGRPTLEQADALDFDVASVVALQAEDGVELDLAAGDAAADTTSMTLEESCNASPGYETEMLTISMIQVFLHAIGALVVGVGLGVLMPAGMPFSLEWGPIALSTAITILTGLLGAAVAVLRVVRIDPISALGGQR